MLVDDDHPLVAKPDDAFVTGDEAVLDAERFVRLVRVGVSGKHAIPVVRVQQALEQIGLGRPFLDAVAEQRLDLPARKDVRTDLVECVDVDDER